MFGFRDQDRAGDADYFVEAGHSGQHRSLYDLPGLRAVLLGPLREGPQGGQEGRGPLLLRAAAQDGHAEEAGQRLHLRPQAARSAPQQTYSHLHSANFKKKDSLSEKDKSETKDKPENIEVQGSAVVLFSSCRTLARRKRKI